MSSKEELRQEREWRRCADEAEGFFYFCKAYWFIKVPGDSVLFELRPPQEVAARTWLLPESSVSLKARQTGWSTLASAMAFWETYFFSDREDIFLSRNEKEAKKLKAKVDYGYDRLPKWLKDRGPKVVAKNKLLIEFANGSLIEAMPSREDAARGRTAHRVVMDEADFFQDPEEAWAGIEPATDVGGRISIISTVKRYGGWFHQTYLGAKDGTNDLNAMFFGWDTVPGRDEEWFANKVRGMPAATRAREYPSNDEECFVQGGNAVWNTEMLKANAAIVEPIYQCDIDWDDELDRVQIHKEDEGPLLIWQEPVPGRRYGIGGDVALGVDDGDYSTLHVLDGTTGRCVASYRQRLHPEDFADVANALGRWYNRALLGIERNTHGESTVKRLLHNLKYPNLYFHTKENARRTKSRNGGWLTTNRSKTLMIDTLTTSLRSRQIYIHCLQTLTELIGYQRSVSRTGTESFSGLPHDDHVMSLGIANMMLEEVGRPAAGSTEAVLHNGATFDLFESMMESAGLAIDHDNNVGFFA